MGFDGRPLARLAFALCASAAWPAVSASAVLPRRVASGEWQEVMVALRTDGAVIVTGHVLANGTSEDFRHAAGALPAMLFDGHVGRPQLWSLEAPVSAVHEELEEAKRRGKYLPGSGLLPHTDGYVYGDHLPDFVSLLCEEPSLEGGENTLIDGQSFLKTLDPELVNFLERTPVDLSEGGLGITQGRASTGPVIQWHGKRLKWRRQLNVEEAKLTQNWHPLDASPASASSTERRPRYLSLWKPLPNATAEEAQQIQQQLELLDLHLQKATEIAEREALFSLKSGEMLVLDNWRLLHSRQPYRGAGGPTRKMWRVWSWTSEGSGLPEGGAKTSQPLNDAVFGEKSEEL